MNCVTSKAFYKEHLPHGLPIFYQPFFLDAITEGNWEVACCHENERIIASMPYFLKKDKYAVTRQPPFAIYQGPYFSADTRQNMSLSQEMEILESLESCLEQNDYYNQNWHPSVRNWLPFHWKGYHQSTRYSYIIKGPQNIEQIRKSYNENVRRNLKKSSAIVDITETKDTDELFGVIRKTFDRKNLMQPYNFVIFKELVKQCVDQQCCSIHLAKGKDGNLHAGMFLIWDEKWVYYIAGGVDDKFKASGAMTLLFDNAIQFAMDSKRSFDFEGSMIPSVEKYFRSFGAVQQEYFVITKVSSPILRIRFVLGKIHPVFHPF